MALFSKPPKTPRWADTGTIVEPSESKKDSGWVAPELPPDTFFNWWQNLAGIWFKWIDARHDDGSTDDDYVIHAEDPSSGSAGSISIRGGNSTGTDIAGGNAELSGGDGTGTGSSKAIIKASTAGTTGSSANASEDYLVADGSTGSIDAKKSIGNSSSLPSGVRPTDFKSADIDAIKGERNTSGTSSSETTACFKLKTSGDMADGFGPSFDFSVEDNTSGDQGIAAISGKRDGADNSGEITFGTVQTGSFLDHLRIRASGLVQALRGLQSTGASGSAGVNGTGGTSDGTGVVGTGGTTNGKGVVGNGTGSGSGVEGIGGPTGYGVVAESDTSGTPVKSSLRVVPQEEESSSPLPGDIMSLESASSSHSKLSHYNGAEFEKIVAQVFSAVSNTDTLSNFSTDTPFAQSYTIPGNSVRVGSTIKIWAAGRVNGATGTPTIEFSAKINSGTVARTQSVTMVGGQFFTLEAVVTVFDFDTTSNAHSYGKGSVGTENSPVFRHQGSSVPIGDMTTDSDVEIYANCQTADASNIVQLHTFVVEVT